MTQFRHFWSGYYIANALLLFSFLTIRLYGWLHEAKAESEHSLKIDPWVDTYKYKSALTTFL